jgi:hypothetical protein
MECAQQLHYKVIIAKVGTKKSDHAGYVGSSKFFFLVCLKTIRKGPSVTITELQRIIK